ncbi:MAG: hypothetical protein L0Z62_46345 [Gemmataceae bacterium]|nr:hypothetical protein [Gemmataceae bacterium]
MTALQGVWARALEEYRELQANSTGSDDPEHQFCMGYVFGAAFGLALSTVRPDLVRTFEPQFRKRGWLDQHNGRKPT